MFVTKLIALKFLCIIAVGILLCVFCSLVMFLKDKHSNDIRDKRLFEVKMRMIQAKKDVEIEKLRMRRNSNE